MESDDALVLHRIDFSETSLVLTVLTRNFGKIQALAKGGRRLKGPFESALDTLAQIRVLFLQKKGDSLDLLTEAKLLRRFTVTEQNLPGLFGAFYVVELIDLLTTDNDPCPRIFDLAVAVLAQLATGTFVSRSIIRFEQRLLREIGQQPSLDQCVECGDQIDDEARRITFGLTDGGVLCPHCRAGHQQLTLVSRDALRAMKILDGKDWKRFPLEKNVQGEIRGLLNNYLSHQIGWRPKLFDWFGFIGKYDREVIRDS
jgi:DNA repair protein RecO (recombination protein O)